MPNIRINANPSRKQYVATGGQTIFPVTFPFLANTDIVVYQNSTKLVITTDYTLSGAGTASGGTMTLVSGATVNDLITIYGDTPVDRTSIYSATVSNLTGDDLNSDFNRDIIMIKQLQTTQDYLQLQYAPYAEVSQDITDTTDRWLPILPASGVWRKNANNTAIESAVLPEYPVGSLGGDFSASNLLVKTNISAGNNIEETNFSLIGTTLQSVSGSWTISSASDLNLTASQYLNLNGQRWPASIGTNGQVVGVNGGVLDYLNVPTATVPTIVNQIPKFSDTFGGLDDSQFAESGTDLLLPADPTVALAAATKQYVDTATAGAALTKTDDSNVTLTLGGNDTTCLLRAASLTLGWTGQLSETRGGTAQSSYTLGDTLYASAANTLSKLAGNITAVKQYLSQTGDGVNSAAPVWATIAGSDITGAALTKVDDTNVTLTLGGNDSTCLLRAASLTLGWTGQLGLTRGGTAASLTADDGGIVYSTAAALAILAATNTAGRMLQSGANAAPSWSTPTYPSSSGTAGKILRSDGTNNVYTTSTFADTYGASQLLYSNGANTVAGLTTANSAGLVTSSTGVPAWTSSMTNGQIIIGSTGGTPAPATLTAGTNITITNGANSITINATGGGSGESTILDVNQVAHGFAVQDVVYLNSTTWTKANANATATAEAVGVVSAVAGVDDFSVTMNGYVPGLSGLTAGSVYYVSDVTAGLLTTTAPTAVGSVVKPMLVAVTTTSGIVVNYRGNEITSASSSGSLVYLATATASASATLEFNGLFSSSYDSYLFVFKNILPATTNTILQCQVGTGGGPTYTTTGYDYEGILQIGTGSGPFTGDNVAQAILNGKGGSSVSGISNSGVGLNGNMILVGPNSASSNCAATGSFSYSRNSDSVLALSFPVWLQNASATYTAIKFYMDSGNITSGKIIMYGIKNS